MLRALNKNTNKAIYSSSENVMILKNLSQTKSLLCPICKHPVIFKGGTKKINHFAHYKNGDCALSLNSETEEHIKGKFLIYKWAKERFKDAIVEMEVYIPSSKQIADVMITFPENHALAGVKVVVEYQHSGITPEKWLERHALYREADLIDIWLLDYKVFYKNSTAINWENARLRKEIEKCIFKYTGFCYYLDTDNEEMIIDFNFETISDKKYGKYKPREYEFHKPCNEPVVLDDISIYYIEDIKAFVCYDGCHKKMIYQKLERLGNIYKIRDKKIQEIRTRKNYEKKIQMICSHISACANGDEDLERIFTEYFNKNYVKNSFRESNVHMMISEINPSLLVLKNYYEQYKGLLNSDHLSDKQLILKSFSKMKDILEIKKGHTYDFNVEEFLYSLYNKRVLNVLYVMENHKKELEKFLTYKKETFLTTIESASKSYKMNRKECRKHFRNNELLDYAMLFQYSESTEEIDKSIKKIIEDLNSPLTQWLENFDDNI